ncbi:MAG: hypothetical protein QF554_12225, partial [Dehalococcoidia bacterium]|nr:hypothetical protein [Dehalococcoidia bacterium]
MAERNAISFLLRCTSVAVVSGAALSGFAFAFFLAGFGGHEKTFFLAYVLASCVAGLVWFAGDWLRPTK